MTVQNSTTARNGLLDAISTAYGSTPKLRIYSGTMPATPATALSGNTLLAQFTMAPAAASGGSKDMIGGTLTVAAAAAGTAAFYRVYDSAGTNCHEQGSVTATGGGGDLTLDNLSIASGQTVNITSFTKTAPGA